MDMETIKSVLVFVGVVIGVLSVTLVMGAIIVSFMVYFGTGVAMLMGLILILGLAALMGAVFMKTLMVLAEHGWFG